MGFEAYLVKLSGGPHTANEIEECIRTHANVSSSSEEKFDPSCRYFDFRDGQHVIEIELSNYDDNPQISCRFALCHPSSMDRVFTDFVTCLAIQLKMSVLLCEDLPAGAPELFRPNDLHDFARFCHLSIAVRRQEWTQLCGPEMAGVSTAEAIRLFIMPLRVQ